MTQVTFQATPGTVETRWYLVDARGQTLGRLAVNVARILRGKHRPQFTTHVNTGEHVIVVNARDIVVTGRKRSLKTYDRYSGYPSGRRTRTYDEAVQRDPTFPLMHAVRGMLQHNTLGAEQLKRLRVYPGSEHPHEAQRPQKITFGELGEIIVAGNR
ncbi:MAG: 50S ribosomal protein L13 [Chloroflexi bacterium]|nr:MAG: 50S ribosomal protein L13 [Chloroflexota bacterium]